VKHPKGKFGIESRCKECKNKIARDNYVDNKESYKIYYQNNKESIKSYYVDNKESYKIYYQNNKESIKKKVL
jgi:hypothetical protein